MEDISCPVCDSIRSIDLWMKDGARYVRCKDCSLVYENPRFSETELAEFYSKESYFVQQDSRCPAVGYRDYSLQCTPALQTEYFGIVERLASSGPGRYLDIGCGTGGVVRVARERGWDAVGQEISSWAAGEARKGGIPVVEGDLRAIRFPSGHFDAVSMFDVLEHLPSPREVLGEVERIIKPGGVLVIETPNIDGFFARHVYRQKSDLVKPRAHICLYNERSARRLLAARTFSKYSITTFPYCRTYNWQYLKALLATRVFRSRDLVQFTYNECFRIAAWK